MRKIRIGNDFIVSMRVMTGGEAVSLEGRDLRLMVSDPSGNTTELRFVTAGNVLTFTFAGREQRMPGRYALTLWENYGDVAQKVVDIRAAFELVRWSDEAGGTESVSIDVKQVSLEAHILTLDEVLEGFRRRFTRQDEAIESLNTKVEDNVGNIEEIENEATFDIKAVHGSDNVGIYGYNRAGILMHRTAIYPADSSRSGLMSPFQYKKILYLPFNSKVTSQTRFSLGSYLTTGIYYLDGYRRYNDELPIMNSGEWHNVSMVLIVTDSGHADTQQNNRIVGQTLILSNRIGGETKIYTRSCNIINPDDGAGVTAVWTPWSTLQGMLERGQIAAGVEDEMLDNGLSSYTPGDTGESIVMLTINNYAVASMIGAPPSVFQLAMGISATGTPIMRYRAKALGAAWGDWINFGQPSESGQKIPENDEYEDKSTSPTPETISITTIGRHGRYRIKRRVRCFLSDSKGYVYKYGIETPPLPIFMGGRGLLSVSGGYIKDGVSNMIVIRDEDPDTLPSGVWISGQTVNGLVLCIKDKVQEVWLELVYIDYDGDLID